MPNFSHGTAGVATFLASLHDCYPFPEAGFGAAAAERAAHLESIADRSDQGFRVYHHAPGGEDLYYCGWCHGPCGTARLFHRIHGTGDLGSHWRDMELACARSVMSSGLPEQRLPGFWNNFSRCCGDAGVIDFMLDLWRETGDGRYLDFARRSARSILERGVLDEPGLRWPQAEHRTRPELIQAQIGLMQGANDVRAEMLAALLGAAFAA